MKFFVFSCLFLSAGVVYVNYYMAQKEEESSTRFIISQTNSVKNEAQQSLTANILAENDETEKTAARRTTPDNTTKNTIHSVVRDLQQQNPTATPISPQVPANSTTPVSAPLTLVKSIPSASINSLQSGKTFLFEFSKDVDIESFFTHFSLTPSSDGKFSGEMNYGETKNMIIVNPVPHLTVGTKYTLTLKQGLQSFDGAAKLEKDQVLFVDVK